MGGLRRNKLVFAAGLIAAVFLGTAFFALRGPYISNVLKKIVLPELEAATGHKVIVRKIYINPFPLYAGADEVNMYSDDGRKIMSVKGAKAYIQLSGLMDRRITIQKIVIKAPEINIDKSEAEQIAQNIKKYLSRSTESSFKVIVESLEIQKGNIGFSDPNVPIASKIEGLYADGILGETPRVRASAELVRLKKEGWPVLEGNASADLSFKDGEVLIKRFAVGSFGSGVTGAGGYGKEGGKMKVGLKMLFMTMKRIFGLQKSGEGQVSAEGAIKYIGKKLSLDVKLKGNFFIQTLMELLKVKEKIEGSVAVKGEVKGPLDDLRAVGSVSLKDGNLFDVKIDSFNCGVNYAKGMMNFTEGSGRLYNGRAKAFASIRLPVVNYYTVNVDFADIDSSAAFGLIKWDPGIAPGKVTGMLATAGPRFDPRGHFEYRSVAEGKDILGRIKAITGDYAMNADVISFSGLKMNTPKTEIAAGGTADIAKKALNMNVAMKTKDLLDLTVPYYAKFQGRGEFSGSVTGKFDDPVMSGTVKISEPLYEGYKAVSLKGDLSYRKNLLEVDSLYAEGNGAFLKLNGNISFRKAKNLFDLSSPEYNLNASMKNADLEKFAKIFYPGFVGTGKLQAAMRIRGSGENPSLEGDGLVENAVLYHVPFDQAGFQWNLAGKTLGFRKMKITTGKSVIAADAELDSDGHFRYSASSEKILLSDMLRKPLNGDAILAAKSQGSGTLEDPSVTFEARLIQGKLRGKPVGTGIISASIKEKNMAFTAALFEDKVRIYGKGRLEKEDPWSAEIELRSGRYDPIIGSLMKEIPEDLLLNLNGKVLLHGDRKHVFATSVINQITLSAYGYSFTNEKEIRFELKDRQIIFNKVLLRSGNAALRIEGGLELGKQYNINLEGSSSLTPLKTLYPKIGVLKGDAECVLSIIGTWERPEINGGITITNGSVGLKDYPYRIISLNGYLYMDNDRVVLQKVSGKIGGGDIGLSGFLYLDKFSIKRYYIDATLSNVTASFSNDFNVNFGGNVLYKGVPDSQMVSGEIKINRARYRERVEWKSWLLRTKKVEKYKGDISGFDKAELNVKITGKDNINIDNNVVRGDAAVDMVLRGNVYRPVIFGRLELKNGSFYFRNNEFRILHASSDFTDPNRMNPFINVSADTVVRGYKIKMNLEGQVDRFNISLSSDPVLKEMDILSLLAVGQTGDELKGLEGGIGASEATSFVTGKLQDVLEERLRTLTGLDRFQIDPHVSKVTGTVEPRVTVSKRLLSDKVFVTYTSAVGSTEEQIIRLEYALGKNVSLVGMRDERGIVGGDVRFRFEFK